MHRSPVTWSSSGSSPKAGIYLAHSTNTNNCCLIESQTSPTVADFCSDMSAIPTGAVIWGGRKIRVSWVTSRQFHCAFVISTQQLTYKHVNRKFTRKIVTCFDSDSAWAKTVMGGKSCESGIFLRELIRSLSFCTANI